MGVYLVKSQYGEDRLVEARTAKTAIAHVVADSVTATVVKTSDLVKLVNAGNKIEIISSEEEE